MQDGERAALRDAIVGLLRRVPAYEVADPAAVARLEDVDADVTFESLGMDSLGRMDFCIMLSSELGIELTADDLLALASLSALLDHLADAAREGPVPSALSGGDAGSAIDEACRILRAPTDAVRRYGALMEIAGSMPEEAIRALRSFEDRGSLTDEVREWLEQFERWLLTEDPTPRRFSRTHIAPDIQRFTPLDSGSESLGPIILFAGNADRFFLPTSVVLQHLPTDRDIVLLTAPEGAGHRSGSRGVADDLPGLCAWLLDEVVKDQQDVVVLGSSGGGGPSLLVGAAIGARRAVSLGGGPTGLRPVPPLRSDHRPCEQWIVYNAECTGDRERGRRLWGEWPSARVLELEGSDAHNVLLPALHGGGLRQLLGSLIDDDLSPSDAPGEVSVRPHPARLAVYEAEAGGRLLRRPREDRPRQPQASRLQRIRRLVARVKR